MSTKEKVLEILKSNGSVFMSGQEIADKLFVTRAAVWKAIKSLEKEGITIEAITNKGYRIIDKKIILSERRIKRLVEESEYIEDDVMDKIVVYDTVDSTNAKAREYALHNPGRNALIIARGQTEGRGRRGRVFYSPEHTGIYMSILIHPKSSLERISKITCITAVAICRAIKEVTGIETNIKWVNDIYYRDKKIGGILTEAITSLEDSNLSYVVVGIGINLYMPYEGFPADIKNIAGSLLDKVDDDIANRLCVCILEHMYKVSLGLSGYLDEYRERSNLIGKYVKVIQYNGSEKNGNNYAYVKGVDDNCHLLVRYDDGREEALSTGEVSVVKY